MNMITERKNDDLLPRDSDTYKRVYDLLEEYTFTWITDAWKEHPSIDAIRIEQLRHLSVADTIEMAEKHYVKRGSALVSREWCLGQVLLRVNDKSTLIAKDVAHAVMKLLEAHVTDVR